MGNKMRPLKPVMHSACICSDKPEPAVRIVSQQRLDLYPAKMFPAWYPLGQIINLPDSAGCAAFCVEFDTGFWGFDDENERYVELDRAD